MLNFLCEPIQSGQVQKYTLNQNAIPLSFETVLNLWQTDQRFRSFFLKILMDCPYASFRFETPAVTQATRSKPFEFVLLDAPGLAPIPNKQAFAAYLETGDRDDDIVEFENLGKNARLIVPCPRTAESAYNHLANFVRSAPEQQKHNLLRRMGKAMQNRLSDRPVWLNTAGGGVSWLHVRLDNRPKYYRFQPYKYLPNH